MSTDQLIALLVADLKPVDSNRVVRSLLIAIAVGAAAAFGAMLITFAPRPELLDGSNLKLLLVKSFFASSVAGIAAVFLTKIVRPGAQLHYSPGLVLVPFVGMVGVAARALASVPFNAWPGMIVENDSLTWVLAIPLLSALPFVILIRALRVGAPTDLALAGEMAGLVASGIGASACALFCVEQSVSSIAIWYGLPIGIGAFGGSKPETAQVVSMVAEKNCGRSVVIELIGERATMLVKA